MNKMKLTELSHDDLLQINGGVVDQVAHDYGYAAGQAIGKIVRNLLITNGLYRLIMAL
jgi:hypothetical protein